MAAHPDYHAARYDYSVVVVYRDPDLGPEGEVVARTRDYTDADHLARHIARTADREPARRPLARVEVWAHRWESQEPLYAGTPYGTRYTPLAVYTVPIPPDPGRSDPYHELPLMYYIARVTDGCAGEWMARVSELEPAHRCAEAIAHWLTERRAELVARRLDAPHETVTVWRWDATGHLTRLYDYRTDHETVQWTDDLDGWLADIGACYLTVTRRGDEYRWVVETASGRRDTGNATTLPAAKRAAESAARSVMATWEES